ncbi:hypothetical protein [Planctomycetes bacterium K23_9]|uniref:Uncharacterized protein n=1 Tax=Stieleria marina TaxID=1930275 RepID=A0A517NVZ2_9BACT|nr:hypothetical protein K239x_32920 [Planctomycetes bacterium K23_9]
MSEEQTDAADQPAAEPDLNKLVADHERVLAENAALKAELASSQDITATVTATVRDAIANPPQPLFNPKTMTTEEYIANKDAVRKQMGFQRRSNGQLTSNQ